MFTQEISNKSQVEIRESIVTLENALARVDAKDTLNSKEKGLRVELVDCINEHKLHLPEDRLTVPQNENFDLDGAGGSNRGGAKTGSYRAMFNGGKPGKLDDGGFKSSGDFLRSATSGQFDPRINKEIFASMGETTPSSGGFSVPTQYSAE